MQVRKATAAAIGAIADEIHATAVQAKGVRLRAGAEEIHFRLDQTMVIEWACAGMRGHVQACGGMWANADRHDIYKKRAAGPSACAGASVYAYAQHLLHAHGSASA